MSVDFPMWVGMGSYGGFACALASIAYIVLYATRRKRGTTRQFVRSLLCCVLATFLMLPPIWWNLNRLELYGPALNLNEITFWLSWSIAFGWCLPLAVVAGYTLLTVPLVAAAQGHAVQRLASSTVLRALNDPGRRIEPLGKGHPWGQLVAMEQPYAGQVNLLTRQLTLLGRENDNDIVLEDLVASRYHAEIRWDHNHVELVDRQSTNGTFLNRQAVIGAAPLKTGDIIKVGNLVYRFDLLATATDTTFPAEVETRKVRGVSSGPATQTPALALVAVNGPMAGARWLLNQQILGIGRGPEQQICLRDESVSRQHAQIVRQRTGYFVNDWQGINGTWLNGVELTAPAQLHPGDVLLIGEIELRCEAVLGTRRPTAPDAHGSSLPTMPPGKAGAYLLQRLGPPKEPRARLGPPRLTPSQPPEQQQRQKPPSQSRPQPQPQPQPPQEPDQHPDAW
ncbi:MAG TPA: FHA domain-containing protein [Ktedonobacterales bacterium]|nr:FHA domain-containing protein [Ktedonobacterales bacterium]